MLSLLVFTWCIPATTMQVMPMSDYIERRMMSSDQSRLELELSHNFSNLLNSLLINYDKNFRPGLHGGQPTVVSIDIYVRTMGPISEMTDTYAFDCYFRQMWVDERLRFSSSWQNNTLSLGMSTLDKLWKPDTYFWNGQGSYLHKLTTPNRLVRLSADGTVLFSSRLTVKARCHMDLQRFPLDIQACQLIIGSFAHRAHEIIYRWKNDNASQSLQFDWAALHELSQFELRASEAQVCNSSSAERDAIYSTLEIRFFLRRHVGYFMINYYVPMTLIVLLSWVAFWINREATGDRIALGVTSVLTLTFLSLDSRSDTPKVEYPTALDVYVVICYMVLFLCILEFTIVHYYTKFNTGDPEIQQIEKERIRNLLRNLPKDALLGHSEWRQQHPSIIRRESGVRESGRFDIRRETHFARWVLPRESNRFTRRVDGGRFSFYHNRRRRGFTAATELHQTSSLTNASDSSFRRRESVGWRLYQWLVSSYKKRSDPFDLETNSVSQLDRVARIVFPVSFAAIVYVYWYFYVNMPYTFKIDS
uniref:Uncharacterized protein n=1 Tax=Plectus sambesii TaxID=2011161 RepID=A0A914UIF3_9BILA